MITFTYHDLEPEEQAAVQAIRLLADERGKTREGRLVAPGARAYSRAVHQARAALAGGAEGNERAIILAAAPLLWSITQQGVGWTELVRAAGLIPAWQKQATGQPITEPTGPRRTHEDYHPSKPPMVLAHEHTAARLRTRQGRHVSAPAAVSLTDLPARVTVHVRTTEIWSLR